MWTLLGVQISDSSKQLALMSLGPEMDLLLFRSIRFRLYPLGKRVFECLDLEMWSSSVVEFSCLSACPFPIFSRAILSGMTFPEFASPESECFILSIVLVLSVSTLRASFFLCDLTSCEQQQVSLAHECLLLRRRVMILHFGSKEACRKT